MLSLLVVNLFAVATSFSSIVITCTEPLIRVSNKYNFYLFPENDFFSYFRSELHKNSQNLFIASAIFIGISLILSLVETLAGISDKESDTLKSTIVVSTGVSTVLYISSVCTLGRVVYNIIDYIENLPLPIPIKDVDVIYKSGSTFMVIGLLACISSLVISSISLHQSKKNHGIRLP
jgi:hypothetical protein